MAPKKSPINGNWDEFARNMDTQMTQIIKNAHIARDEAEKARSKAEQDRNAAQVNSNPTYCIYPLQGLDSSLFLSHPCILTPSTIIYIPHNYWTPHNNCHHPRF